MSEKYVAKPTLKIGGQDYSKKEVAEDIIQIVVEESLHLPGMFTLIIRNDYYGGADDHKVWEHEDLFTIGTAIEIGFSASTTDDGDFDDENKGTVIKGEITAIETHFTSQSQAPIIVRGYDESHRLHRGRHSRSFQNKKDSDIVKTIATEAGISTGTVDSSGGPYGYGDIGGSSGYVFQQNQTNMEFLRERAARHGFELFLQDSKLYFRKPSSATTLNLEWLKDIHSFRVRVSSAEQVSSVEVRGWDYSKKKVISEKITSTSKVLTDTDQGSGKKTASSFNNKPKSPSLVMVDQPISQSTEAKALAQALFDELGGEFAQADARGEGNPKIRPGRLVKLSGMGSYSGSYYITETRHLYHERIYTTEFSVRGLRGGDLLQTLETRNSLQPGQTLIAGIVADNNDPKGWGRVRVKLPSLTEDHMSNWARIVTVGAGGTRGVDWLPEVNDEVLVGFEHGDIHRPYIIGGVWNGTDKPPEKPENAIADGKVRLKTIKTRQGHIVQFIEEDKGDSKQGLYITTAGGQKLTFNDTEKFIELKNKEGHQLKLDQKNKKVELKTKNGHQITMDDDGKKVDVVSTGSLNAKSGKNGKSEKININGGEITLTGATKITLKVGGNSVVISSTGVTISGTQVNITGKATAKLESKLVNVKGTASVGVECSGITKVSGSVLKLN
ncbi:MAG: VgrG-related protein [Cyanobacteria bacterium J06648_16]